MTTRLYRSTDSGAPVLTGQTGSLTALLDAVLVGDGSGIAYGTGANEKTAAGWTRAFTGTSKSVYRNSMADGGTGHYFRIDDSGSTAAGGKEARLKSYTGMSDVDTPVGTDINPANAGLYVNGGAIRKSQTADATARPWVMVADSLTCWLWIQADGYKDAGLHGFGDFTAYLPGDDYRSFVLVQSGDWASGENRSNIAAGTNSGFATPSGTTSSSSRGLSIMRNSAADPASALQACCFAAGYPYNNNSTFACSGGSYAQLHGGTATTDGSAVFAAMGIASDGVLRGGLRGLHAVLNNMYSTALPLDYAGAGGAGSNIIVLQTASIGTPNAGYLGAIGIETALDWS